MNRCQKETSPDQSLQARIEARVNPPPKNRTTHDMSIALKFPGSKSPKAVALLVGRDMLMDAKDAGASLGGGWRSGISIFAARPDMRYALLIAPTPGRIRKRAPYLLMAPDLLTLTAATHHVCGMLSDVTCKWVYLSRDEQACAAVRRVTLADAAVVGGAQ